MSQHADIGVGVIGLGFMGQTHLRAYERAKSEGYPCKVVAVCDIDSARLAGVASNAGNLTTRAVETPLFHPNLMRTYQEPKDLINDPRVDLVSICTYTETHVDLAIAALGAGKHVLVEKPIALASSDVRRLANASRQARTLCMPAMCMRFWPEWEWLHARIQDHSFGQVRNATFQRLGSLPQWGREFYGDINRSGGALVDLHIHDVDFLYWCFGRPKSVSSAGNIQHVASTYKFKGGPHHVVAEAALDLAPADGFHMRYLVDFERATVDFDLARTPRLMLHIGDKSEAVNCGDSTGYDGEIRHIVDAIRHGHANLRATVDEAAIVQEILEAERQSLTAGAVDLPSAIACQDQ